MASLEGSTDPKMLEPKHGAPNMEDVNVTDTTSGQRERRPNTLIPEDEVQAEKLLRLKRSRSGHASNVTRKHSALKCSIDQEAKEEAEDKIKHLQSAFLAFDEAHQQYMELAEKLEPEEAKNYQDHRDLLAKSVRDAEFEVSSMYPKVLPNDSVSQKGSCAGSSSTSSARAKAAARKAALMAKAEYLQRQQELQYQMEKERQRREDEELKTKMQLKRLELEAEISAAAAEEETLARMQTGSHCSRHSKPPLKTEDDPAQTWQTAGVAGVGLRLDAEEFVPRRTGMEPQGPYSRRSETGSENRRDGSGDLVRDLTEALRDMTTITRLPAPEPTVFCGDPLQFANWQASFQTLIHQKGIPLDERMHYLRKYLAGPAKEAVEGYFLIPSPQAYEEARALLEKRYGTPFIITSAFKKKLEEWPKIGPKDSKELMKFADFLHQCEAAIGTYGGLNTLDSEIENSKIISKLPEWLILRWGRTAMEYKDKWGTFPPFAEFRKFITRESEVQNYPIIAQRLQDNHKERPKGPRSTRSLMTQSNTKTECMYCEKKNHETAHCRLLAAKPLSERKSFFQTKGLCFGCLMRGHISKMCRRRATCDVCNKRHPTLLHDEDKGTKDSSTKEPKRAQSFATSHTSRTARSAQQSSLILPVWVSHEDDPGKEELVYALLDTQSDTTFITESLRGKLGAAGISTQLKISTMTSENQLVESKKVKGLIVRGFDGDSRIHLPPVFTRKSIPADKTHIPTPDKARQWSHLSVIASKLLPTCEVDVGLLIGYNCPRALAPREVISTTDDAPFAQRTDLGWGIVGGSASRLHGEDADPIGPSHHIVSCQVPEEVKTEISDVHFVMKTTVKEVFSPRDLAKILERDFTDTHTRDAVMSTEDRDFLRKMNTGIHKTADGQYEMPLPFKCTAMPTLPNNKEMASRRILGLQQKMEQNTKFRDEYTAFMNGMLLKGHAERVPEDEQTNDGHSWYIPHHGVYHPRKDKIRVVFDASAKHKGVSLNDVLLQGPDLTNTLNGVLCRFRREKVAFMCDIQQMFHQFRVNQEHRNFLKFLWWDEGDTKGPLQEHRMTVHLFGATSSPGCANFGLKKCASDSEAEYGTKAADFIRKDFYVDDGLTSVATVQEAVGLVADAKAICREGGLHLHKFASNSVEVMESIPEDDRCSSMRDVDVLKDTLPIESALGIQWCVETDTFRFHITLKSKPETRRGILSTVSSIFDPLGLISPLVLTGRRILQELCREKTDWDSPISDQHQAHWDKWKREMLLLDGMQIDRCYKPKDFGEVKTIEMHHFSDASTTGYGQCSYVRQVSSSGQVHCALAMSKARVAPLKPLTVPRLELSAAVVSVKVSTFLEAELQYQDVTHVFWSDSKVVLGYISNEARRFHVFVANRIQQIREHTTPDQWRHVKSQDNPADFCSRGLQAEELVNSKWLSGPDFLWETEMLQQREDPHDQLLDPEDPELKKTQVVLTTKGSPPVATCLEYFSDWIRAKKAIARCQKYITTLQSRVAMKQSKDETLAKEQLRMLNAEDLRKAESQIVKIVQRDFFSDDMKTLSSQKSMNHGESLQGTSHLRKLDVFIDEEGVLRVGGRIRRGSMPYVEKHPAILPKRSHVTTLLIKYAHERTEHGGRGMTVNLLRSLGYWIIGCVSAVKGYIHRCVTCRKLRSKPQSQKMADLPEDRLEEAPPFTYCAVDFFGPWYIKQGRKELKRYGALFTCLCSRAIHIEVADSLSTDSFINALRRFVSLRGPVRQLRSDRGTNFVGAKGELTEALSEMDHSKIQQYLLNRECDYIVFKMNVPSASHMGGIWERQIRTVRNVLASLMDGAGTQLNDEALRTFLYEAAAIVNSRPLTTDNLSDPLSPIPLTPNQLLTMKCEVALPPPGKFPKEDLYSRKYWRRVQHLANEFWSRWKNEYLQSQQLRQKWTASRRDITIGDVVIIKDDLEPRGLWNLGRVLETYPSQDGHVRKVKLAVGDSQLDSNGRRIRDITYLERPIHKLVLLVPREEQGSPYEEP